MNKQNKRRLEIMMRRITKEVGILLSHSHNHHQDLHLIRAVGVREVSQMRIIEVLVTTEIEERNLLMRPRMNHSEEIIIRIVDL